MTNSKMAEKYVNLAKRLFAFHRFEDAEAYFKKALTLYTSYSLELVIENVIKIYSNLVIIANKRNHFDEAIVTAGRALLMLADAPISEEVSRLGSKLIFNKVFAILARAQLQLDAKEIDEQTAFSLCKNARSMMGTLITKHVADVIPVELDRLTEQLTSLEEKIWRGGTQLRS